LFSLWVSSEFAAMGHHLLGVSDARSLATAVLVRMIMYWCGRM